MTFTHVLLLALIAAWFVEHNTNKREGAKLMAKLSTLAGTLAGIETTLGKVKTEIETLKGQLGDADIPADAQATLDRLQTLATALDDLNPDAPAPTP